MLQSSPNSGRDRLYCKQMGQYKLKSKFYFMFNRINIYSLLNTYLCFKQLAHIASLVHNLMKYKNFKDEASATARNVGLFERQACYLPRMRAILMDWIMEVCEAYKLRRVTYYLAVDYIDRYLTIQPDVPKTQLQLVGVCCLFMAAKVEEVYPPKLSEFAYVCDGACTDDEIVDCERLILNSLG